VSAWNSFRCRPLPGREEELASLLADYREYLQRSGQPAVTIYRSVFGGEASGVVYVYMEHVDAADRAAFFDGARSRSAENPITKATASGNPPFSDPQRSTFRSLGAPEPPSPQVEILDVRAFDVEPVRRAAAEQVLTAAVANSERLGQVSRAFVIEASGAASGRYRFTHLSNSHQDLEAFYARLVESGVTPLADGITNGVLLPVGRQLMTRFIA
jgi:hypothetical protein